MCLRDVSEKNIDIDIKSSRKACRKWMSRETTSVNADATLKPHGGDK